MDIVEVCKIEDLVSIIVPVHNAAQYLSHCVDSLLKQTYCHTEILLVENGSLDESMLLCQKYENSNTKIRSFHLEEGNVSKARNFGIRQAKGRYVIFVDSDDYCEPDYCETLIRTEKSHNDKVISICGYQIVKDYHHEIIQEKCYGSEQETEDLSNSDILRILKKGLLNMLWNKIFDREFIVENGLKMREDITLGEDLLFNLDYMDAAGIEHICMINRPLYNYVRNGKESLDNKYYSNLWELTNLFLDSLKLYCDRWKVNDNNRFANVVYYYYLALFQNTLSDDNMVSRWSKMKHNSLIMKDIHFKEAVAVSIYGCRRSELWLARRGNYFWFYLYKLCKKKIGAILKWIGRKE